MLVPTSSTWQYLCNAWHISICHTLKELLAGVFGRMAAILGKSSLTYALIDSSPCQRVGSQTTKSCSAPITAGALRLLASVQQFHRVATPTILAHALLCINVQSSKVSHCGLAGLIQLPTEELRPFSFEVLTVSKLDVEHRWLSCAVQARLIYAYLHGAKC